MNSETFIIAEIGVNHNGSMEFAEKLVTHAKEAGADAVKFQTFKADQITSRHAEKATYQRKSDDDQESQQEMLRKLELTAEQHRTLFDLCGHLEIEFISTPFNDDSVDLLNELGVRTFKIGSGEITNFPLLAHIASKDKSIILSTGMSTLEEVGTAIETIREFNNQPLTLLHCLSQYPAPIEEVNLRAMQTLRDQFELPVGYSDHTDGIDIALAAVALGASVIEKHLTLDRSLPGPDHMASLEPDDFSAMVKAIRRINKSLGNGVKAPAPSELQTRDVARRSLIAAKPLKAGQRIEVSDICIKRPGTGIPPSDIALVAGKIATNDIPEDQILTWDLFE